MKRRKISRGLLKESVNKKITIILGARQVGKTTLLKALYERLCKGNDGLFLDLDVFSNFEKISSFENLKNTLFLNGYREKNKSFFYLFLDEFQRHNDLPMIMKNVYDNLDNVKIYASGSSSLKIKEQIQDSLAGRKRIYRLHPLDFEEFLWFKDDKEALKQLSHIKKLSGENLLKVTSRLYSYLKEFMVFGGYPEVVLQDTNKKKAQVLESIFDLYVKKDLIEYLKVEKVLNAKRLIEYLAINNGQKIQYAELSQISSLDYQQVVSYIEILKETYLLAILRPFFTNKNKELVKIPKLYFLDNGVRNYFINNFNEL
ncbi:TPA: ATP-binding protein, partial [Candidatus Woesearchaeota archaeon]|nr:ATP-binding protein [Candidatus Woesearchaeota archaeon]